MEGMLSEQRPEAGKGISPVSICRRDTPGRRQAREGPSGRSVPACLRNTKDVMAAGGGEARGKMVGEEVRDNPGEGPTWGSGEPLTQVSNAAVRRQGRSGGPHGGHGNHSGDVMGTQTIYNPGFTLLLSRACYVPETVTHAHTFISLIPPMCLSLWAYGQIKRSILFYFILLKCS